MRSENRKPGATDWHLGEVAADTELAGYLDRVSVTPGEQLTLRVTSTIGDYTVTAYRLGSYGGAGACEVWHADAPVKGSRSRSPHRRRPHGDDRLGAVGDHPHDGLAEGSYLLLRAANGGKARYAPVVVRSATTRDRLVLDSAVLTYQAYNRWGGYSLYKGPDGSFASRSSTYPGLVGTEVGRAYLVAGTPKTLQVTSHSPVPCATKGRTFSDATYYTIDSGAGVFAAGTMMWARALFGEPGPGGLTRAGVDFAGAATDALLTEMAGGPVGGTPDHTPDHPDDD